MTSDSQKKGFFNLKDEKDQGIQHKAFFEFATTYRREMLLEIIEGTGKTLLNNSNSQSRYPPTLMSIFM